MVKFAMLFAVAAADMSFDEFKNKFGKVYNGAEEQQRREIFEANKQQWGQHESGAILGATIFSDLTLEEFQALNIRGLSSAASSGLPKVGVHEYQGETLAASVDWTTKGAVTPVKNQGQCGSCWAFSTTGGLEGAWQLASGNLVSMSEQQFVDCSKQNDGCNGGLMDTAFSFAEGTAVATEGSYAYTGRDGSCKSSFTTAIPQGGVTGYKDVSNSASALQSALNGNPVSVAIQADQSVFQQYTGGVITSGCGSNLDHGVLAVGYDGNTIKVKNSWGSSWGDNGYVQIDASQCGITTSASYPTVSASESLEVAAPYEKEWAEFQAVNGQRNGDIPEAFKANVDFVKAENAKGHSYTLSHTGPFAAMTLKEFQEANIRGFQSAKASGLPNLGMHEETPVEAGATIDWTTKGAVTPVKNQGQCGSCWAFSTTGGLEGAWQLSTGNLVSMSEQQFVDCDTGSAGCNGGSMEQAFGWAANTAVATESSYAYTARDGSCKSSFTTAIPSGGVTGYKNVGSSASALTSAIMNSPISVAIEADQSVFQMYSGGVIDSGCGTNLDHGVLAVGVNSDGSIKVKNSWGTSWGANGYVNIATSQCGITSDASYPTVSGSVSV